MKVKIEMSDKEKKIAIAFGFVALIIIYFVNKLYLIILDVQFEDSKPSKLLLKTGFIFPVKTEIDFTDKTESKKIKWYGYILKTVPIIDPATQKATGEYSLQLFKNEKALTPFKNIIIHRDEYYVQYYKTPLGRI